MHVIPVQTLLLDSVGHNMEYIDIMLFLGDDETRNVRLIGYSPTRPTVIS